MTYGQTRLRLAQALPGVLPEKIDGWIQDAYTEILDRLEWKRQESQTIIQAPASYTTGTVTTVAGSATITGVGTTWTTGMTGRTIRIANQNEYYTFTWVSATSATLDRAYEQAGASELAYRIDQQLFTLPESCRIVRGVKPLHQRLRPVEIITPADLDAISVSRNSYGSSRYAVVTWDKQSDPPLMQLELYPIPQSPAPTGETPSFSVDAILDQTVLDTDQTSTSLLPWVRPGALIELVQGYCDRNRASVEPEKAGAYLQTAAAHDSKAASLVTTMAQINARQRGPTMIKFARELRRPQGDRRDTSHGKFVDGDYGWD